MKNQVVVVLALLVTFIGTSQNQNIQTKSVAIEHLIPFVIEHIESKSEDSDRDSDHITFLVQTPLGDLNTEDKVILKQAFKLISERLADSDYISIVTYSGFNGVALQKTTSKNIKAILHSLENLKSSINEFHKDGIDLGYQYSKENFEEAANNTVIMIRNPESINAKTASLGQVETMQNSNPPKSSNAVLLTAITLLPQIISVIKD
jgi:hypothetical protein